MIIKLKKSETKEPFSFTFVDDKGKLILKSENYKQRSSAVNGIESVRKNSQVDKRYELKESSNGKYFFNVKATNGQIVGTSTMFNTIKDRDDAIAYLKENALVAATVEKIS